MHTPQVTRYPVNVACVTRQVEALWELDDMPKSNSTILQAFTISYDKNARLYEVGLLSKGSQRPTENKDQAEASAKALRRRLEKNGAIDDHDNVLMKEYQDLNAIEKEDQPQKEGCCFRTMLSYRRMLGNRRSIEKRPCACPIPDISWNMTH